MVCDSFLCKKKDYWNSSVNRTVESLDPSNKNSYSVCVYIVAVHSLIM